MDDVTASIIIACQTAGAVNSINKLGFSFAMLGRKAIEFGAESISVFSDLQEETQKFGTVFSGVQDMANKHVQDLIDNFGQSELSAKKMMAQTGDLLRGTGMDASLIANLSGELAKYGSDLTSFSNYAGGAEQATFALTKAMLGEQEMAKSLGVFIKYDTKMFRDLEKEALSTGLAIGKNGELVKASNEIQARAIASFAEIIRQKGYVLGDYNRNQDSIANSGRRAANSLTSLKTEIGRFLNSFMQVGSVNKTFADFIDGITAKVKANSANWAYYIASGLNMWRGGFEMIWAVTKTIFTNIAVVGKYAWDILVQAWKDAPGFFSAVWEDVKNLTNSTFEFLRQVTVSTCEFYVDIFDSAVTFVMGTIQNFRDNWRSIFSDIVEIVARTGRSIVTYFVEGFKNMANIAATFGKNFWDLITGKKSFTDAFGNIFDSYKQGLVNIRNAVAKEWEGFSVGKGIKQQGQVVKEFGKNIASAYKKYGLKLADSASLFKDTGKNTAEYLEKNGIKIGEFASISGSINSVIDRYNQRQKEIDARRGKTAAKDNTKPPESKAASSASQAMANISKEIFKFRASAQSAVLSNSVDAIRLQSRMLFNNANNPQVKLVEQGKRSVSLLERMDRTLTNMSRGGSTLSLKTV